MALTLRTSSRVVSARHSSCTLGLLAGAFLVCGALSAPASAAPYSAIVVDAHTGKVLHAQNADSHRYPASLTKIMTLYMLFDFLKEGKVDMHTRFVATPHAAAQAPSKIGIRPGNTIMVVDAIRALVTKSANDVAVVVAENLGGTEVNFARMMTDTARRIGMSRTTFRNASGLPDSEQVTTARDMVTLARRMMQDFPEYYDFFSVKYFSYAGKRYKNHNKLLFNYKGTDGIKTGYTRASGFNLVASVQRDHKHLIGVVIGGKTGNQRNAKMRHILDRAFPDAVSHAPNIVMAMPLRNPMDSRPAPAPALASAGGAPIAVFRSAEAPVAAAPAQAAPEEPQAVEEGDGAALAYQVQVGAYVSQVDAQRRLTNVQTKAADVLRGRKPLTVSFAKSSRPLYRARFAGFTEDDARDACGDLKRLEIDCIVMRAE